jgi:hypothetical protein
LVTQLGWELEFWELGGLFQEGVAVVAQHFTVDG